MPYSWISRASISFHSKAVCTAWVLYWQTENIRPNMIVNCNWMIKQSYDAVYFALALCYFNWYEFWVHVLLLTNDDVLDFLTDASAHLLCIKGHTFHCITSVISNNWYACRLPLWRFQKSTWGLWLNFLVEGVDRCLICKGLGA